MVGGNIVGATAKGATTLGAKLTMSLTSGKISSLFGGMQKIIMRLSTSGLWTKLVNSAKNNLPELRETVEFLKRGDIPSAQRREVIEAFTDNSKVVTLGEDTKVYRYWVEGFNGPKGHWVTRNKVGDPLRELALPNSGPYKEAEWILPKGTEILEGMAAPNFKQPGGAGQIFIPNP